MSTEFENIELRKEDKIAWIVLNRPHRLNALTLELMEELSKALDQLEKDNEVRAIVITGAGERAFSVGADVTAFTMIEEEGSRALLMAKVSEAGQKVIEKIERIPKPVIAAIRGYCLGGGMEIALACDFRIASEDAELGQPEINLGIIPGWGGTQRMVRIVGLGRAKELLMLGDRIKAEEAYRIGLVNRVVPPDKLEEEAKALAEKLAKKAPIAVMYIKYATNFGSQAPLLTGLTLESLAFGITLSTEDAIEGISAFLSKREPEFKGR